MTQEITLAALLARTKPDDTCLLWMGHANAGKFPQWRLGGKLLVVRREIYKLVHGELPSRLQVGVTCETDLCVHPDCLVARTRSKAMRGIRITPDRKIRIAQARRASSKLLDMGKVRAIRASDESGPVIEVRYGLKKGYASRIRAGLCWVDHSSPFTGLGAR